MEKKSDTRKFLETMWIITKYDVLPWLVGAGLLAAVIVGAAKDAKNNPQQIEDISKIKSVFSKTNNQR